MDVGFSFNIKTYLALKYNPHVCSSLNLGTSKKNLGTSKKVPKKEAHDMYQSVCKSPEICSFVLLDAGKIRYSSLD